MMKKEEYILRFDKSESAPGWDAIDSALKVIYQNQQPKHWGTALNYSLGGANPLDGISAYQSSVGNLEHLHFCSYGFSSLYYDEDAIGGDFSRFGFELTFRLANNKGAGEDPNWVCNLMQNLAKYVFSSGKWFEEFHWISANGPIRADFQTDIVGLVFARDPALPNINTPHGNVDFIQMFGITEVELNLLKNKELRSEDLLLTHKETNPYLITDLYRKN